MDDNRYRALPKVDELADSYEGPLPRLLVVETIRTAIAAARSQIGAGSEPNVSEMVNRAIRTLERSRGTRVINATGVLLHTNLGRSLWSKEAVEAATAAAEDFSNLELDAETGARSRRGSYVGSLVSALTGAEDCLVVNNNASAVMLALAATSAGLSVPVARGELIEIGGSYRLPDVMEASGAHLVEVGTTNRTRAGDYETALQVSRCGAILLVHPSNYRVDGFVSSPSVEDLSGVAKANGVPLIYDIGSGLLDDTTPWIDGPTPEWLKGEPAARQALEAGADVVTFSGDKLLGGPQAGIIAGNSSTLDRLRAHPMARALRVDGTTYAALGATLEAYTRDVRSIPFWRQALEPASALAVRARALADEVGGEVAEGASAVGGGSVPGSSIPSPMVRLTNQDHLFECLLSADVPLLTRREAGDLLIDLRAVSPADDAVIANTIESCR